MKMQKYLAELLGTFVLTLLVGMALKQTLAIPTPVLAALVVGVFVYTVGAISGTHLNPAVTIAMASVGKIKAVDAALYIVVQILGAVAAMFALQGLTGSFEVGLETSEAVKVGVVEALGAFILVFGISSVVYKKVDDDMSGIVIGSSLLVGILATSGISNGVLNPAVAIGLGSISFMYMLAPIVGAVVAAWAFKYLAGK